MSATTVEDEHRAELAARLAATHEQVEQHRAAVREAMEQRAALVQDLHVFRAYPCSRIAAELGVAERTVWSWLYGTTTGDRK